VVWDGQKGDLFDQMDYPEVMRRRDLKEAAMMTYATDSNGESPSIRLAQTIRADVKKKKNKK